MKTLQLSLLLLSLLPSMACSLKQCKAQRYINKPRTFVVTDISNEPDDRMSLIRLLTYSNELDINDIRVVASIWKNDSIDQGTVYKVLGAYGKVWAKMPSYTQYPTADELSAKFNLGQLVYWLDSLVLSPCEAALELVSAVDNSTSTDPHHICIGWCRGPG